MTATDPSPASPSGDSPDERPPLPVVEPLPVPVYLLVEPMVPGKKVLEVTTRVGGPGAECLRRAGAADVISFVPERPSLAVPDAGVDIVLCGLPAVGSDEERGIWLAEIQRALCPGGFCVLRLPTAAFRDRAQAGAGMRTACADLLLGYFATVDIVEETRSAACRSMCQARRIWRSTSPWPGCQARPATSLPCALTVRSARGT